ncbi:nucleotidyltransferase family protein [Fulvivirga sp. M361]|uniref:nucleotidyltransferase family protein n=1 Tax=Fulvivirga sp. M361 TaxID=2594266 RepID=UPI00117B78FA|nr:nucleotidyltransferase family protein [Fulvivirga sp. M361]TRX48722.1 nucleotidyltransferase family protein [Fulvivirga sp. M361]
MTRNLSTALTGIISDDKWMLETLKTVRSLALNDCWIGAGFVRNKIWDYQHGLERQALNDIDVIYFDRLRLSRQDDLSLERTLNSINPALNWSVKNQARMHLRNGHRPYKNCEDAMAYWPETATSVAVRLNTKGSIEYIAPCGLEDLFNLVVAPTPNADLKVYQDRLESKAWKKKWRNLVIQSGYRDPCDK